VLNEKIIALKNGVEVLAAQNESLNSINLKAIIPVGVDCEPEGMSGIRHFVEHLMFEHAGNRTAHDIAVERNRLGVQAGAHTSRKEIVLEFRFRAAVFADALSLFCDMLFH
jgi:predicted Zn-dependent peptidase